MRLAIALLLMTTSLGAGSAALAAGQGATRAPDTGIPHPTVPGTDLTLIDSDEDEDEGGWLWFGSDDDTACAAEDDDDEGGNGCAAGAAGNPARAGTVPPPKNGLFTDGTAPVVKSN